MIRKFSTEEQPTTCMLKSCCHGSYLVLARPCARVSLLIPGIDPFHRADRSVSTLVHLALRVILTLLIYANAAVIFIVPSVAIPGLVI